MKNSKKGISLIVLIITIVVMIILAAAVILTLNQNNPTKNANQATYDSDVAEIQSAVAMYVGNYMAKSNGISPFAATGTIRIGAEARTDKLTADGITNQTQENKLSWTDIGLKKAPASINDAAGDGNGVVIDAVDGAIVTAKPVNTTIKAINT